MYASNANAKDGEGDTLERAKDSFLRAVNSKENGLPLLGIGITLSNIQLVQIASQKSDFLMIDMEHAPLSPELVTQMVHASAAASQGLCFSLIRIPSSGVEWVKWALDSGAAGIIIPMINTALEMKEVLDRALYPPHGRRSFGPSLAAFVQPISRANGVAAGVANYYKKATQGQIAILPMIESKEGLENIEEILKLDGVSGAFVGPFDLRLGLGLPGGLDGDEAIFSQAIENICSLGARLNKPIGSVAMGANLIRKRHLQGMQFLVSSVDAGVLESGFSQDLTAARAAVISGATEHANTVANTKL